MTHRRKKKTPAAPTASPDPARAVEQGPPPRQRELSAAERKRLRGFAHALKPLVHVGRDGLSAGTLREIDRGLESHELIKVRLQAERDERAAMAEEIARRTRSAVAGAIGLMVVLYRQQPLAEERRIELGSDLYGGTAAAQSGRAGRETKNG
jgi:RNA-binding protein